MIFLYTIGGIVLFVGFIAMVIASRFSKHIALPIYRAIETIKMLSKGNIQELKLDKSNSNLIEIQEMTNALSELSKVDLQISKLAESVASGVLDIQIRPRSVDDKILNSLNKMVQQLHEQRKQLEKSNLDLQALATTDALTGLANRRHFNDMLIMEFTIAKRNKTPISILMLDIDFFKKYNDYYGHQGGDVCLFQVAQALKQTITRAGDIVARYGGEEFVVIASQTEVQALELANKIRLSVESLNIEHPMSHHKKVTVSIGVASMIPKIQSHQKELIHNADKALYRAKELGRNCVEVFTI